MRAKPMFDITPIESAEAAKEYYFAGNRADYYSGSKDKPGIWSGKVAEMMGLKGIVKREDFAALCDHINPATGEPLTVRKNKKRRVGYDLCYGPPKSVSVMHALTGDHRIQLALEGAFADTLKQIEKDALTRVRIKGKDINRSTGNLLCAQFTHKNSRPTERDGRVLPDPHLHCHGVVFNVTFDPIEKRWKAAQLGDIKRDANYFQECMHNRLIRRLQKLGYQIQQTGDGWEIAGIPREVIDKFSQRSQDIKRARKGEEELLGKKLSGRQAARLGKRTRKLKKDTEKLSELELKEIWRKRLTPEEFVAVQKCHHSARIQESLIRQYDLESDSQHFAQEGFNYAKNKHFATKSVMDKRQLIAEAIKASYGDAHFETIERISKESDLLTYDEDGRTWCTTKQVREEERYFIKFAREGRTRCEAFANKPDMSLAQGLSDQQTLAYRHVLTSHDQVMGIRGKAGTGKTTMMQRIVKAIEQSGKTVKPFAPSHGAVEVLRSEGFKGSETIQQFLVNEALQAEAQDCVLWIDEAGLLSSKQMAKLASIARRQNCRLILTGDTGQHSGVERGDALRILETHGGLRPAQLDQIFRQKDPTYNDAVKHLANGEIDEAFEKLDILDSIQEITDVDRPKELAVQYISSQLQGRTALVVSPTNREAAEVTKYIRRYMIKKNTLTGISTDYQRLKSLQYNPAELSRAFNYQPGQVVEPHADMGNRQLPIGKRAKVVKVEGKTVWVENHKGEHFPLDLTKSEKFNLYEEKGLFLMRGDKIQIKKSGKARDGSRILNGTIDEVEEIAANGDIRLKGGKILPVDFMHIDHGYCVTSHSSQGRTVDDVYIAESAMSFPAASLEQFYVSCSRGRERLRIFTDDISELKQAISRSCSRKSTHDYDWDVQARLRRQNPSNIQKVSRYSHQWLDNFGKSLAAPTKRTAPESPRPEPTQSAAPSLSLETNPKTSIDIDL
ncbi:MobF family relaxase [Coraliomargarita algicola]|uniref:MobF family relaxase n=1 Tax=Coraliomargarita algicola TaxID=3092156 RepID=A0ABZ0RJ81_9BACT|nr:MobF family relaxase [Coraliomargarita sp. J2-16]WPJ95138.1 MobF family relaxase [Coraliomargarita sp. J2-16]